MTQIAHTAANAREQDALYSEQHNAIAHLVDAQVYHLRSAIPADWQSMSQQKPWLQAIVTKAHEAIRTLGMTAYFNRMARLLDRGDLCDEGK